MRGRSEARYSNSSYMLGIEHADQFFQRIWVAMNRRSHDLSPLRLVFIGDGADWIWRRVGDLDNERSRHILDFCHAADHLADVCKVLDGRGAIASMNASSAGAPSCARAGLPS